MGLFLIYLIHMETKYTPTIGLEIHAELNTKTKMFCNSKNDPDEKRPNVNICPICMGHPGTLPTINKQAVKNILKIGLAVGGQIAPFSEFDRKNYFYPDIPKNYQISQYKYPLISGGKLAGVDITRVHLEEDTARSQHVGASSLVDYNRAGVPLMELVTEPVIKSSEQAVLFAKELQLLLRTLGASEANMEKGEMRVEANVSVSKDEKFGTKVEVKNLNSFRVVGKAIEYEIKRQIKVLEEGGTLVQETRGFNENTGETFSQRKKESSHDYRYFPEPDLPKLAVNIFPEFEIGILKGEMPELPDAKRARFLADYGIKKEDAEMYVADSKLAEIFENAASQLSEKNEILTASNYITSDLIGLSAGKEVESISFFSDTASAGTAIASIVKMISADKISSRGAKDILKEIFAHGGVPEKIAEEKGLLQKSDATELKIIVAKIIEANPQITLEYKAGKAGALQYLIGQVMKETAGSANPKIVSQIATELLS